MASNLGRNLWSRLGHCGACMRTSFRVALLAWILVPAIAHSPFEALTWVAVAFASVTSAVWLAHLVAFSVKAGLRSLQCPAVASADRPMLRRSFAENSLKAIVTATLISTLPAVAQMRINIPACPDDNYKNSRTGYGACGQFCNSAQRGKFDCPRGSRPVYRNNGDCNCCPFSECS